MPTSSPTTEERPHITDLLDSHRDLLRLHRAIMVELMAVAIAEGIEATTMSFIVAATEGEFGEAVLDAGPGFDFVFHNDDGRETAVVPLGVEGLLVILDAIIPEAVEPVLTRAAGTVPVLIVNVDDESAIVMVEVRALLRRGWLPHRR